MKDASGGVLPGATVTATSEETGTSRSAITSTEGRYRIPALAPGNYKVAMELQGFRTVTRTGVVLQIRQEVTLDFDAELTSVAESVTVVGDVPTVETKKAEVGGIISQKQIENLPLSSREYLNLALLMPGTSQDGRRPFYNNVNISAGMQYWSSGFIVDGVRNTWAQGGDPRQDIPEDAVQEFKVASSQFKAEDGLASAGMITVVTKSGTNTFQGTAFNYYRTKALNSRNFFEKQKPDFHRYQFGGSAGGPIVQNKSHFFVAVERTDQNAGFTVNTGGVFPDAEGTFPAKFWRNLYSGRWDYQFSQNETLFVRYGQEDEFTGCFFCGGTFAPDAGFDFVVPRKSVTGGLTSVLSPKALNEFRFQYAIATFNIAPSGTEPWSKAGQFPPERLNLMTRNIIRPSLVAGGANNGGFGNNQVATEKRLELRDDFSYFVPNWYGEHNLKFGLDFNHIPFIFDDAENPNAGVYTFATNRPYDPNDPTTFPILFVNTLPNLVIRKPTQHVAFYVQDDWAPITKLTFNVGLRYDRQWGSFNERLDLSTYPRSIPFQGDPFERGDRNNWGPRFGFAYDPSGRGTTAIRGGYGVYYNNIRTLNTGEHSNFQQNQIRISNPGYPDPYRGQDPLVFASTAPPNVTILAQDFQNPRAQQFNVGVQRELWQGFSVSVDGLYIREDGEYKVVDLNPRDPLTGRRSIASFGRIDMQTGGDTLVSETSYRAIYVKAERQFKNWYQFLLSYTLAKSEDNDPSRRFVDRANPSNDFGPSPNDRRHTMVGSGFVRLPYEIGLGAVVTYRSPRPFSARAGRDLNGDTFTNDYVPGTTRNQGRRNLDLALVNAWRAQNGLGPVSADQISNDRLFTVDLRATKQFRLIGRVRLEAIIQVFNLLNTLNLSVPYTLSGLQASTYVENALSPSFGKIVSARDGRQGELAVRLAW